MNYSNGTLLHIFQDTLNKVTFFLQPQSRPVIILLFMKMINSTEHILPVDSSTL
jgi:hypothetical protein